MFTIIVLWYATGVKRLLIVEDNHELQDILKERFSQENLEVIQAFTGEEGLGEVKQHPPDMVLLDIMLPGGMNGFDVLEQVKKNPLLKNIHVIVLTNLDSEQKTALDIGAEDYIVKSNISLDEIVLKVKNQIG